MSKFIAAETAECVGCRACEIACMVVRNRESRPLSHDGFRPHIHIVGKSQAASLVAYHHYNDAPCVAACPVYALAFQVNSV